MTHLSKPDGPCNARILVLDDQLLMGMDVAMMLEAWGYDPVGPFCRLSQATRQAAVDPPDAAILDVHLGNGETSLPLAHRLATLGIPFLFLTGYDPAHYHDGTDSVGRAPYMRKPQRETDLRDMVEGLLDA